MEGTAETAEIAEASLLCGLCELRGFIFAVRHVRHGGPFPRQSLFCVHYGACLTIVINWLPTASDAGSGKRWDE